ncbi:hypothetical protein A2526_05945 [candidate division WOR-1 bacterium RIFOXYD2_FULL_36_8]|uniref:Response regulatory domain-containing protein n=1 Tax=candidate division WOR-1 bacterium RIFOXYB2_FULL_36_35 TaxID=1802578 RepID=A0A1F4S3J2_UNCSA|nr:MAG: hypothetical protein A2230_08920 [candidate division WOR-1 bacterium RIFOXYA2_FULL_36_21]OGC14995.1 MAG: hypothetical protein A2290_01560 [candidate division WOR-1 bacterium RIFOXYB2_FULL_36_35]OGC18702.1 MAG: hypothetical protein A2282_07340 [candidate division WOR-1 bacterium RIFOXYA12_FULL_36_13]OGC37426.1 MAG: hypothetical protein A2526_05945 [candidate division WOR-1 bacterium RIFOXYD2_FULL_36_8]
MSENKQKILLLEDDQELAEQITEILSSYDVTCSEAEEKFLQEASNPKYKLILMDFDLKERDGLMIFRELRKKLPLNKVIMFSSSNSIPLAVQATKLGVLDFLRKPFDSEILVNSVGKAIETHEVFDLDFSGLSDTEWLEGVSPVISELLEKIKKLAIDTNDLVIYGEKGISREVIAKILHRHGRNSDRRFSKIDIASFDKNLSEAHFFLTLKELLSFSEEEGIENKNNFPGTIFLSGVDSIPEAFCLSVAHFIKEKKSPVRIILSVCNKERFSGFETLELPPLRLRREDIPIIALSYLIKHAPRIKYISPQVISFLMYYDFPGNYDELRDLIQSASVCFPGAEVLNFKSLPLDVFSFNNVLRNKVFSLKKYNLSEIRSFFEKEFIDVIMWKVNHDPHKASRFLDVPHSVFSERIKTLGLSE